MWFNNNSSKTIKILIDNSNKSNKTNKVLKNFIFIKILLVNKISSKINLINKNIIFKNKFYPGFLRQSTPEIKQDKSKTLFKILIKINYNLSKIIIKQKILVLDQNLCQINKILVINIFIFITINM